MTRREQTLLRLQAHEIQPSAQRLAVAEHVLWSDEHPSADRVWSEVRKSFPMISRATVYNTLNLFVEKGLLRELVLEEGNVVFDPRVGAHHHFIDEDSGRIHDVDWDAVRVVNVDKLPGLDVREYMVVMRGRSRTAPRRPR